MKFVIVLFLVGVLAALAGAGYFMLRRRPHQSGQESKAMARALAMRVALSVCIFLLVMLAWSQGWIKPTGVPLN
jgi:hypothetical protein